MITLPHTGIQVPHDRLRVTSLRQVDVGRGIAWSAPLRQGRTKLGTINNRGDGGPTMFDPENDNARRTVAAYVEQCRTADGQPLDEEDVMDELTAEYEWARDIVRAEKRSGFVLRHFDDIGIAEMIAFTLPRTVPPAYERAVPAAKRMELPPNAVRAQLWMGPHLGWVPLLPDPPENG